MPELVDMDPQKINRVTSWSKKCDSQLRFGFGGSEKLQSLPEPNRSQCVALLGKMLLVVIKAKQQP